MALPEHCDISLPRSSCSLAGPWQALPVPVPPGRCNLKKRDFFDSSVGSKSTRPDRVESMARLSVRCRFSHDSEWNQAQRSGVSSFGRKLSTAQSESRVHWSTRRLCVLVRLRRLSGSRSTLARPLCHKGRRPLGCGQNPLALFGCGRNLLGLPRGRLGEVYSCSSYHGTLPFVRLLGH